MKKKSLNQFKSKKVLLPKIVKGGNVPYNACENSVMDSWMDGTINDESVFYTLFAGC